MSKNVDNEFTAADGDTSRGARSADAGIAARLWRLPGQVLILLVRFYQTAISPWLGPHCRYTPTCSEYFIVSVRKYGALRGSLRGCARICRCHPFHPGGHDPP